LRNAARDLLRTRKVSKDVYPKVDAIVGQYIVDALADMATVAGIDPDAAQGIFAEAESEKQPGPSAKLNGHTLPTETLPLALDAWLTRELPPADRIMGEWLTATSRILLNGPTGLGKTNLALAIAGHCAAGRDFLHWRVHRPARCLYIDGEMSRRLLKRRARHG
jgi:predicted ATP-dependent serine protease